jgi:hypothetical protein
VAQPGWDMVGITPTTIICKKDIFFKTIESQTAS